MLSNKVYLHNILRSIIVCGVGCILSWIAYAVFFSNNKNESEIAGLAIFFIYTALFFYAVIIENVFYFLLKKNTMKAFLVMISIFFAIIVLTGVSLELEFFLEIGSFFLVFALLQILGFLRQRKVAKGS